MTAFTLYPQKSYFRQLKINPVVLSYLVYFWFIVALVGIPVCCFDHFLTCYFFVSNSLLRFTGSSSNFLVKYQIYISTLHCFLLLFSYTFLNLSKHVTFFSFSFASHLLLGFHIIILVILLKFLNPNTCVSNFSPRCMYSQILSVDLISVMLFSPFLCLVVFTSLGMLTQHMISGYMLPSTGLLFIVCF